MRPLGGGTTISPAFTPSTLTTSVTGFVIGVSPELAPPPVRNRPRLSIEVTPIDDPQVEFKQFRKPSEVC